MVGLLAARPLRLTNFTEIELGWGLIKHASGWLITVAAERVKNRRPLEFDFPTGLIPYLDTYLAEVRPRMLAVPSTRLWVAWKGAALSKREVHHCLTRTTKALIGRSINPHLFRDCAATSLSLVSLAAARSAASLLGHQHFSTTERHYVRARQLDASRTVNAVLSLIESSGD